MFLGSLLGSFLFQYTMLRKMSMTMMNSAYVFGTLPLLVAIHVLRREVKLRQER
jgi:predicted membrane-bound spermidine synthase